MPENLELKNATQSSVQEGGRLPCHGSGLADIMTRYNQAVNDLREYRAAHFKRGQFVRVNSPSFHGIGMVCAMSSEVPPNMVPVKLENDNTWWYPIEDIAEVLTDLNKVPRSVRRMKLRWNGYKMGAAA